MTNREVEAMTDDFIARQYRRGRRLARGLTVLNLISILIVEILSIREGIYSNLLGSIVWFVVIVCIFYGKRRAKWLFILYSALNLLLFICGLMLGAISGPQSTSLWICTVLTLIFQFVTSIMLICSSSVNDFLYGQANG